ncbi:IclR family transcriptional regulator [Neobacillus pocheonensis]|uniref:IclR family transcriptional regulator n=1 Tax=Neobacillus pocheonensis TaxID=363869 RepID=A0ABT0WJR5_9BACI|nr:IclR family transcriptional regulator [Neobacillus pocheonensis]
MQNKNITVVKSMDVLNLFLHHSELTLNEMVDLLGVPKTSVHRMVGSFETMGFLQKNNEGKYLLGLQFLQFGQLAADRLDIRQLALPIMKELRDTAKEAVNLIIKDGNDAIYIEKLDTPHPVRLYTKIGRRAPLYAGACSRIILAFLKEEEQEHYLQETELAAIGTGTITDKERMRQVLAEAREFGYTISYSELENDTVSIAAPIFDHTGRLAAGLSIAGPDSRFGTDRLPVLIDLIMNAAKEISARLGYREGNLESTKKEGE